MTKVLFNLPISSDSVEHTPRVENFNGNLHLEMI